jgi:hypothetical protein
LPNQNFRVKNGLEVGTGATISSGGNITAGIITATYFVGSGSQLTGIVASTGTASYANISGVSSSVVGGAISATSLSVTGVSTFDGAVKIRNGYNLNIGDNNDLRIYNDGTNSRIQETGSGAFYISGSDINIQQDSTNKNFARFVGGGAAELYYNDSKKFETSGIGITVTGTINSNQINVSGVVTATNVVANQINLSGVATATTFFGNLTGTATTATLATNAQGLTGNPNITVNNISSSGIATLGSSNGIGTVTIGVGNTALLVQGNARITGILTVGTSSIVFDGSNNSILVGSATTISTSGFQGSGSSLTALNASNLSSGTISSERYAANSNAYGIRTVQSGGSPTGGNDGDIYYIY